MLPRSLVLLCALVLPGLSAADVDSSADEEALHAARLPADGPGLLDFFRKRTPDEATREHIEEVIARLGSDHFREREEAQRELVSQGVVAAGLLREAARSPDPEVRRRAGDALAAVRRREPAADLLLSAVRQLGRRKPRGAAETLLDYLPFAEDAEVAEEVVTTLSAVAVRGGEPEPVIVRALADTSAVKRGAAGAALARASVREQMPQVRRLLRDPDASVRRQVALALVEAREKSAVPVLIALLAELPADEAERVESMLVVLAGEAAPEGRLGDAAERRKYRDAWADWWRRHGGALDLAKIDTSRRWLGHTLVVCFGTRPRIGTVIELDAAGRTRWQMPGLQYPVDAQALDGRRVLVTEYIPGRVTERNHQGDVLRSFDVPSNPLSARRLSNGHTFITTRLRVYEVDRAGKEVWDVRSDGSDLIVAACPLRGGQVGVCYRSGKFVRMNRAGKVLASVQAGRMLRPMGTHIQALPNGHVLIPLFYDNKIAEFDGSGREVWSVAFGRPTCAQRLPNGHTLAASYGSPTLAELDASGREVKSQRCEARVMFAERR